MPNVSKEFFLADRNPSNWILVVTEPVEEEEVATVVAANKITGTEFEGTVTDFNAYLAVPLGTEHKPADVYDLTTGALGGISEAPVDGTVYARKDASWVAASSGGVPTLAFFAHSTTNQALTSNVWATILFDAEDMDTSSAYDTGTGRFTPQTAGWYQCNASVGFNGTNITILGLSVVKNGTTSVAFTYLAKSSTSGGQSLCVAGMVYLNGTTDYIVCQGIMNASALPRVDLASGPVVFSAFLMKEGT